MINKDKENKILLLLSFLETWERFSYVGMRTLLVLYLTTSLGFSDHKTYSVFGLFAAISYAVPVLAGILADKLIGFQRTLILGAFIMCVGHLSMVFADSNDSYVYIGLALIAVGTGFFKGNVHNLLGSIHKDKDTSQRDKIFSLFNISINLGSLLAAASCGYVAYMFGWHYGFGLAGVGMVLGLSVFLKYRYILGNNGIAPNGGHSVVQALDLIKSVIVIVLLILSSIFALHYSEISLSYFGFLGIIFFILLAKVLYECDHAQRIYIAFLITTLIFLVGFAAIQMQLGSLINLFILRNVDRMILGYQIPAAVMQALNPFFVIVFGLLCANAFARYGYQSYMKRFALGLFANMLCFGLIYLGCIQAVGGKVELIYILLGIASISFAEICLFPMVKVLFVTLSPLVYRGFMMGFFMFGMSYSNLVSIFIAKYMSIPTEHIANPIVSLEVYKQGFFSVMLFCVALLFLFSLCYPILKKIVDKR